MQVSKWGNSLAVRLPAKLVQDLGLKEGDEIDIHAVAGKTALEIEKKPSRQELLERLRLLRGTIPADYKFDREEASERRPHDKD